jgi:hypothetical protein
MTIGSSAPPVSWAPSISSALRQTRRLAQEARASISERFYHALMTLESPHQPRPLLAAPDSIAATIHLLRSKKDNRYAILNGRDDPTYNGRIVRWFSKR